MKKFIKDINDFKDYAQYSVKSELKREVAGSFLGWLWWVLDPLLFMLVYCFVAVTVFRSREPYFPVFVFIGLNCWNFFSRTVKSSVKLIVSKKNVVTKVYVPKVIFIFEKMGVYGFKMLISFLLTAILMLIYKVPLSFRFFYVLPLLLILSVVTFGVSTIVSHFGVFVEDLFNVITVVLQLGFYITGIFYSIENKISTPLLKTFLIGFNPLALIITDMRNVLLYNENPHFLLLLLWLFIGVILSYIGIRIIYKYENSYVKVI